MHMINDFLITLAIIFIIYSGYYVKQYLSSIQYPIDNACMSKTVDDVHILEAISKGTPGDVC